MTGTGKVQRRPHLGLSVYVEMEKRPILAALIPTTSMVYHVGDPMQLPLQFGRHILFGNTSGSDQNNLLGLRRAPLGQQRLEP